MIRTARISVAIVLLASQAGAMSPGPTSGKAKAAALVHVDQPDNKKLASDKKFFGPGGDYPADDRPDVSKKILSKVKGPDQPYPSLQATKTFDKDYIKDENSDTGAWKAQFEYDALRKKLAKEEAEVKSAQDKSDKEGKDADEAKKKADEEAKGVSEEQKEADAEKAAEETEKEEEAAAAPSADKLETLKQQVKVAEENYAKEKVQFEECKKQLDDAKKEVDDLQAQMKDMEAQLAADTKLWAEAKTVKMNAKKAKESAAAAKRKEISDKLKTAQDKKKEADASLAREKTEADYAKQAFEKKQADLKKTKADLEKAAFHIKKLRGEVPAAPKDMKSSACSYAFGPLLAMLVLRSLL
jgi:DNA repair exonuclease SbcCD ATPase subunit